MTGNLSRTVLRGAGARESTYLPDLTKVIYYSHPKKQKNLLERREPVGFFCYIYLIKGWKLYSFLGSLLFINKFIHSQKVVFV